MIGDIPNVVAQLFRDQDKQDRGQSRVTGTRGFLTSWGILSEGVGNRPDFVVVVSQEPGQEKLHENGSKVVVIPRVSILDGGVGLGRIGDSRHPS